MPDNKKIAVMTSRLKQLGGYILAKKLLFGLLLIMALSLGAFAVAAFSHQLFYLPVWFRTAFIILFGLGALGLLIWYIIRPMISKPSPETLALMVEKTNPDLKNRLIASLQLEKNLLANRENYSPALILKCIDDAEALSSAIDFKKSYRSNRVSRGLRLAGITAILTLSIWLISPTLFKSSFNVFSHPLTEIPREITYELDVLPRTVDVLKFDDLDVDAVLYGSKLPKDAKIYWKVADEWRSDKIASHDEQAKFDEFPFKGILTATDTSWYRHEFKEIRHDFQYYVEAGERRSDIYQVRVVDKPRINNIKLTYHYPKYTGLAPVVIDENDGTVQALRGTTVKLESVLNKPVESGKIVFGDGSTGDMEIENEKASTSFRVTDNGSYHLEVSDAIGHQNPDPIEYRIFVQEDNFPQIRVVKPGVNIDLDDYLAFDLGAALSDDYGFSRLVLHYQVHYSPTEMKEDSIEFQFDKKKTEQLIEFYWDLSNQGLYPGSYVDYYFEVFDNDYVSGPKSTISRTYTARHPTIDEMFADIEGAREDMIQEMIETLQEELSIKEDISELHEDVQFQDELEWETQKDIERTKTDQQNLMNRLEKMAEQFNQINEEAKNNDLLTLEMIQKLAELQKLFDQIATPEMKEAMKKLQEAMENMDQQELEKALEEFEMSTEEMIKNIERSIAQLKKFQIEQKMQAMVAMAEKLLENQKNANQRTENADPSELPKIKDQEDQNTKDMKNLKEQAEELRKLLKENQLDTDPNGDKFCQSVEKSDAELDMEKMSDKLQKKEKQGAQESGETAENKVEDMLKQMSEAQSQFNNQMSQEMAEKMRQMIDEILYLSDQQEGMYNEILPLNPRSQMLPEFAQQQQVLKSEAERIKAELVEIAKQSMFVNSALDRFMNQVVGAMQDATGSLTELNGRAAINSQTDGIYSLNQSAQTLIESLNSQSQCNSSCNNNQSMFEKMKSMCKGQKKVNKQTQSQCKNPSDKPGKPNPDALRRLAAQQNKLRQGIAEMMDEFGERKDVPGRLEKMAEEMKKVIEALESGDIGEGTLDRQKQIYSRMLDFQLSLERRDYSDKRRAEGGEDVLRRSPEFLEMEQRLMESEYRAKLEKFMQEAYPPEYESLIKDYYKALLQNQEN